MKLSNETLAKIALGSTIALFGSCGGSFYLSAPTSEDEQMAQIQRDRYFANERFLECAPRERGASISDKCRDYLARYDSLGQEAAAFEKTPEYISSQQRKRHANYLLAFSLLSLAAFYVSSRTLRGRTEEENQSTGEQ